jgi:FMN-dependent NADH-azoreductase
MPHLLHLDSAATVKNSRSREITAAFADAWRAGGPQYAVTHRDLHRSPLPHLADAVLHWPPRLRPEGAASADPAALAAAEALQDELVGELLTTSLTLAETVPALAPQRDRARAELAALEAATATARRLTGPAPDAA